jgi:hypothetical protein
MDASRAGSPHAGQAHFTAAFSTMPSFVPETFSARAALLDAI